MDKKLIFSVLVAVAVGIALLFAGLQKDNNTDTGGQGHLKRFSSYAELNQFLKTNREQTAYYGGFGRMMYATSDVMMAKTAMSPESAINSPGGGSTDYSTTNVQVQGVDEADIVKNDGKYIYSVSGNKLVIVDAYPAHDAKIVSETELQGTPTEIFVNNDKLVVFGNYYEFYKDPMPLAESTQTATDTVAKPTATGFLPPRRYYGDYTYIMVYDIKDKAKPVMARNLTLRGNYRDSRMIGDYVYAVVNMPVYYYNQQPVTLPMIKQNGAKKEIPAAEISYFDVPDYSYNFINVVSLNTQNDNEEYNSKTYLAGSTQNMFVSENNIYLTYTMTNYIYTTSNIIENVLIPTLPSEVGKQIVGIEKSDASDKWQKMEDAINSHFNTMDKDQRLELENNMSKKMAEYEERMAKEREKTAIHKIAIYKGKIDYKGQGTVPGTVLNQFSMDEYKGYLRIATTTGGIWTRSGEQASKNNIYVIDENLKIAGMVEDLAPGEKIYSARFMGDRAYLVTFKKTDPLFVIDLKDPENPKVLGKLKIPGYSDYLHPYDENHVIGLGKEAAEAEEGEGDFAWYQGIKLALFDVSEPENPREISKYSIGDRGTDSYALHDHKAFLFDRKKNLLVIPVLLAEIDKSKYADGKAPLYAYGDFVWQGAYVFSLDLNDGFQLKGRVTHVEDDSLKKSGYYYYSPYSVKRTMYIGSTLYTLSDKMIKMNDLDSLDEINKVKLLYKDYENIIFEESVGAGRVTRTI